MKINLTPAYTDRVTKCRAGIITQQQTIAKLRAELPKVQDEAKSAARMAEAARQSANPRDDKSVKFVTEANTRAEMWQTEIGKVEKQIEDAVAGLHPLCMEAGALVCEIVDEVMSVVSVEVNAFHRRHFESEKAADYRTSEVISLRYLEGMKAFHIGQFTLGLPKNHLRPGHDNICIEKLSELLGENDGVRRFLFDGTESVDLPAHS